MNYEKMVPGKWTWLCGKKKMISKKPPGKCAAICDKKGKAIPREGGGYCICPHALTVPLNTAKPDKKAMKKGLVDALKPLILQTVNWHKNLKVLEDLLNDWENPKNEVKS